MADTQTIEAPPTWDEVSGSEDYKGLEPIQKAAALTAWTIDTQNYVKTVQPDITTRGLADQSNAYYQKQLDLIRKDSPDEKLAQIRYPEDAINLGVVPESFKKNRPQIGLDEAAGTVQKQEPLPEIFQQAIDEASLHPATPISDEDQKLLTQSELNAVAREFKSAAETGLGNPLEGITAGQVGSFSGGVSKNSAQTAAGLAAISTLETPNLAIAAATGPAAPFTLGALNLVEFLGGYFLSGKAIEGASDLAKSSPIVSQLRKDVSENPESERMGETLVMAAQGGASLKNLVELASEKGAAVVTKQVLGGSAGGLAAEAVRPYVENGLNKVIGSTENVQPASLQSLSEAMVWGALLSGIAGHEAQKQAQSKAPDAVKEAINSNPYVSKDENGNAVFDSEKFQQDIKVEKDQQLVQNLAETGSPKTAAVQAEINKENQNEQNTSRSNETRNAGTSPEGSHLPDRIPDANTGAGGEQLRSGNETDQPDINAGEASNGPESVANAQESKATPVAISEPEAVKHKVEPPPELKPVLDALGARYDGIQEGYKEIPSTHQITLPDTGDTINVPIDATAEEIKSRIDEKRGIPEPASTSFSKIGRVVSEVFGEPDQSLGISGTKQKEAVKKYADSWVQRGKELVTTAKGIRDFTKSADVRDEIVAKFDAADNEAGYLARQAANHVKLIGVEKNPDLEAIEQKAATFVRQSEGNKEGMLEKLRLLGEKNSKYKPIYSYAKDHWESLQKIADAAKEGTDAAIDELSRNGINVDYRENYVKGAYFDPSINKVIVDESKGADKASANFKKAKVFNDYAEAIEAGFEPKELRLDKLTESAILSQLRVANRAKWAESLSEIKMPDGSPAATEPIKAVGKTEPSPDELKTDEAGNVIVPRETKTTHLVAPDGYKMVKVANGAYIPIHEELAPLIEKLSAASHVPLLASKVGAFIKHNILVFDVFHGSRFGQMQMAFEGAPKPSYHKGLALLEYSDSDLSKAVSQGKISQKEADFAKENRPKFEALVKHGLNAGRISDALYAEVTPIIPLAKGVNHFIFQNLSRGIITQSAVYAYDRNASLHPEWSPEKLARYTAKEVNTYYRNLGNQGIFKSKTWQDASRLLFFAPQWIEGMVRSEARGYGQIAKGITPGKNFGSFGNISKGMATGLVAYFAVAQIVNLLTRGQPTWKNPEPGHQFDAWVPDAAQGSKGFFVSPLSVFAENTHDILKYATRGEEPLDIAAQLVKNKLHPQVSAFRDLFFGTDFYGRPLHGWERLSKAAYDASPVPLVAKSAGYKGAVQRQIMSMAGIKATTAPSATSSTYELANKFLKENSIDKPPFSESPYSDLRSALRDNDLEKANTAYQTLLKKKSAHDITMALRRYEEAPFTGIKKQESAFRKSLDEGEMVLYNQAMKEKENILKAYYQMRRTSGNPQ